MLLGTYIYTYICMHGQEGRMESRMLLELLPNPSTAGRRWSQTQPFLSMEYESCLLPLAAGVRGPNYSSKTHSTHSRRGARAFSECHKLISHDNDDLACQAQTSDCSGQWEVSAHSRLGILILMPGQLRSRRRRHSQLWGRDNRRRANSVLHQARAAGLGHANGYPSFSQHRRCFATPYVRSLTQECVPKRKACIQKI